ncbi:hypothetical protein M5689_009726 [Euphorbia peplus]|nr:hypothetical protein M5689_009726 [Euphorbia peplus]
MAANNNFHGYQIQVVNRNALDQLHGEQLRFWETSTLNGDVMVQALDCLGRALRLSYSDYTWRQLTDTQLEIIANGYEVVAAAHFMLPPSHYRRQGIAREVQARRPLEDALREAKVQAEDACRALFLTYPHPLDMYNSNVKHDNYMFMIKHVHDQTRKMMIKEV